VSAFSHCVVFDVEYACYDFRPVVMQRMLVQKSVKLVLEFAITLEAHARPHCLSSHHTMHVLLNTLRALPHDACIRLVPTVHWVVSRGR
jgi:hypothetical protein